MITVIDTNIIVGVLEGDDATAEHLATVIDRLADHGSLFITPVVYAELLAAPSRSPAIIDAFLQETPVRVDWELDEAVWRAAGLAYRAYGQQRRTEADGLAPRRILADFIIGAHALHRRATLLTWDDSVYRTYFSSLTIVAP